MKDLLPKVTAGTIPAPPAQPRHLPPQVAERNGEISPTAPPGQVDQTVSSEELFDKASGQLKNEMFGAAQGGEPAPPTISMGFVRALRIAVQLVLMYMGTPQSLKDEGKPPNAKLVAPAIGVVVRYYDAICGVDERLRSVVDIKLITSLLSLLEQLQEVHKVMSVATGSIEAGISRIQTYLYAIAQRVYTRVTEEIANDALLEKDLEPLIFLFAASVTKAKETAKSNAKRDMEAEAQAAAAAASAGSGTSPAAGTSPPSDASSAPGDRPAPNPAPLIKTPSVRAPKPKRSRGE